MHRKLFALFLVLLITFLPLAGCKQPEQEPETPAIDAPLPLEPEDLPAQHGASVEAEMPKPRRFDDPRFTQADAIVGAMEMPNPSSVQILDSNGRRILYEVPLQDRRQIRLFDENTMSYTVILEASFRTSLGYRTIYAGRVFDEHVILMETVAADPPLENRVYLYRNSALKLVYDRAEHPDIDNVEIMPGHYIGDKTLLLLGEDLEMGTGYLYSTRNYVTIDSSGRISPVVSTPRCTSFHQNLTEWAYSYTEGELDHFVFILTRVRNGNATKVRFPYLTESFDSQIYYVNDTIIVYYDGPVRSCIAYNVISSGNLVANYIEENVYVRPPYVNGDSIFWPGHNASAYYATTTGGYTPTLIDFSNCFSFDASVVSIPYDSGFLIYSEKQEEAIIFRP